MMRNVLCWEPGKVRQVINPYAEHISDSLFRAVHSDWELKVSPPVGKSFQDIGKEFYEEMTPLKFLEDFLREDRPHALAAILGTTGSGKSHLVHWMRLNLQKEDDRRMVLVVRKSGTSLRAIVEMIINELPTDDQQGFRDTLNRAGEGTATRGGQKQQLLNDLAHSIREEIVPDDASELEHELVKKLPDLFQDPYMRAAHFLHDGSIIADIVDHIFAPSNAGNRPDRRRTFDVKDLSLGGNDFVHASMPARGALHLLDLDPKVAYPLAVDIINRNLDTATSRTLSFSGDRVEELMGRLRAHLKKQGRELILLVEEFARLQGIDRALLQAITTHGDENFCKMRSAIAVTTGFFESVAETAYMRTTHIVDMDQSAGRSDGSTVTQESLSQFTARYLNAARLGGEEIAVWGAQAKPGEQPPSKCTTCGYRDECHATFGSVNGFGLYPFTPVALWNAACRVDETLPQSLNPRILQNNVLAEVLDVYAPSIQAGEFPSYRLLEKWGGPKELKLAAREQLRSRRPDAAERLTAFLEIYDGTGQVKNLPIALRNAFNIPEIPGADEPIADPRPATPAPILPTPGLRPESPQDAAIESWINGGSLDQNLANELRPLIYAAIGEAIDWDMLGLERTAFAGKTGKPFQTGSIGFDRQTTTIPAHVQIKLLIPGDLMSPTVVGLALQGLLRANKQQSNWEFKNGDQMLSAFLDCVAVWSGSVENQLRTLNDLTADWNHSIAALQLLCIGAAIGGKLNSEPSIEDMIDAVFDNWPPECPSVAPEMKSIYARLLKEREKLADLARAQISSMKGGRKGAMLNPHSYVRGLKELRRSKWRLGDEVQPNDNSELGKLYVNIREDLGKAAAAEFKLRCTWLREMEDAFGTELSKGGILSALSDLKDKAKGAALAAGGNLRPFEDALEAFKAVQFDDAVIGVRALAKHKDPLAVLPQFGRGRRPAIAGGQDLKRTAAAFIANVDQNLSTYIAEAEANHRAIGESINSIDHALEVIETDLIAMAPTSAGSKNVA